MSKAILIVAWALAAAIVVFSVVPPELRPISAAPHDLEHFAIFAAAGFAFGLCYGPHYSIAIVLVIFAGAIEIGQLFLLGRHASLADFVVDAMASCIGLAASHVLARMFKSTPDP